MTVCLTRDDEQYRTVLIGGVPAYRRFANTSHILAAKMAWKLILTVERLRLIIAYCVLSEWCHRCVVLSLATGLLQRACYAAQRIVGTELLYFTAVLLFCASNSCLPDRGILSYCYVLLHS